MVRDKNNSDKVSYEVLQRIADILIEDNRIPIGITFIANSDISSSDNKYIIKRENIYRLDKIECSSHCKRESFRVDKVELEINIKFTDTKDNSKFIDTWSIHLGSINEVYRQLSGQSKFKFKANRLNKLFNKQWSKLTKNLTVIDEDKSDTFGDRIY